MECVCLEGYRDAAASSGTDGNRTRAPAPSIAPTGGRHFARSRPPSSEAPPHRDGSTERSASSSTSSSAGARKQSSLSQSGDPEAPSAPPSGTDPRRRHSSVPPKTRSFPSKKEVQFGVNPNGGKINPGLGLSSSDNPSSRSVHGDHSRAPNGSASGVPSSSRGASSAPALSQSRPAGGARANSRWTNGPKTGIRANFRLPDISHVNVPFAPKLSDGSHDISIFIDVPAGMKNPVKKEQGRSRAEERTAFHNFTTYFLECYNQVGPTFTALAASAADDDIAPSDGHDSGAAAGPTGRDKASTLLPPPQDLLLYALSNDSVIAANLRFPSEAVARRVHSALEAAMPPSLSFANPASSLPHHHSLSRKITSEADGASSCFTTIDIIGLPPSGTDRELDAFSRDMLALTPFGGAYRATADSVTLEVSVSPITLVEKHIMPIYGDANVDCSKDSIFITMGGHKIEIVVLYASVNVKCACCASNCHRIRNCARKARFAELKLKEKTEREQRNSANAERERANEIVSLEKKSLSVIDRFLSTTGVSNASVLDGMRRKLGTLLDVTDPVTVTSGLTDISGLAYEAVASFADTLVTLAVKRESLRPPSAPPASAPTVSCASAPSPVDSPVGQPQLKRTRTEAAVASEPPTAASAMIALDVTMTPTEPALVALAPPPGLTLPRALSLTDSPAPEVVLQTAFAPAASASANLASSSKASALDLVARSAFASADNFRRSALEAVVADVRTVTAHGLAAFHNDARMYFTSVMADPVRLPDAYEHPAGSSLDGSDAVQSWSPLLADISSAIAPLSPEPTHCRYELHVPSLPDLHGLDRAARFSFSRSSVALLGIVARALPALRQFPAWSTAFINAVPYHSSSGPHSPGTRTTSLSPNGGAEDGAR